VGENPRSQKKDIFSGGANYLKGERKEELPQEETVRSTGGKEEGKKEEGGGGRGKEGQRKGEEPTVHTWGSRKVEKIENSCCARGT